MSQRKKGRNELAPRKAHFKVARNEVKNASFAQRSAHCEVRNMATGIGRTGCRAQATRARGRRTFESAYPDPQILPQCNISSNYPLYVWFFWVSRHRSIILAKKMEIFLGRFWEILGNVFTLYILESVVYDGFAFIKKGGFPYVKYGNNWHVKG